MMKKAVLWILIILWMAVLFGFSSQEATESKKVSSGLITAIVELFDFSNSLSPEKTQAIAENLTFIVRKSAHFIAYAILGSLVFCLAGEYKLYGKRQFLLSIAVAFLYACSDEFHQTFVKGRSGEIRDVTIDTIGATFGALVIMVIKRIKKWLVGK